MQMHVLKILSEGQAKHYFDLLKEMDWKEGKARTKELTGSIKKNLEIKPQESEEAKKLSGELCNLTVQNADFQRVTQFRQMMAYKFNNYAEPGGTYHRHTDAPFMGNVRTDFTAVLALTDPDNYVGGDHHVVDPLMGETILRPKAGELILYETGYPHWVDPIESGQRISALSWVQSRISGERNRGLLKTLSDTSKDMETLMFNEDLPQEFRDKAREWFVNVGVAHSGLYRMWSDQ